MEDLVVGEVKLIVQTTGVLVTEKILTLPPLEAAGFLLHRERPPVAGLTLTPQAFNVSVCPTATSILIPSSLTFLDAL